MCIVAMAWAAHPRWHLVVAGNRDELHARPAAPMDRWDDRPDIIAGRDLQSGGTWLGVSGAGRFAVVTNLRGHGDPAPDRISRGALVTDLLTGQGMHADPQPADLDAFNPFNLLFVEDGQVQFLSNRPTPVRTSLSPGVYGLSNGALDEPWPKTLHLKAAMLEWIVGDATDPRALFAPLRSESLPAIGLPPRQPSDAPLEAPASPIFIRHPIYGTRCSSVVAIATDGTGIALERRFDADGQQTGESSISFTWPFHLAPHPR